MKPAGAGGGSSSRKDKQSPLGTKGFPIGQEKQNEEPPGLEAPTCQWPLKRS